MGKAEREKGKAGEREFAAWLRDKLGVAARRGRQFKGTPDSPDVVGLPGVHIEVKRRERLNVEKALDEAAATAGDDIPLVAHRRSRKPWLVTFQADSLVELAQIIAALPAPSEN